ncbi:erythromycin resistance leader peptide [Lysinibacillus capsici]|nr:hypothetical protein EW028_11805 [Lysinibacillus sp. OL1]WBF58688.1 erythromycin resistance leader peptide [Lysinibacillus sp. JK80]
MTHAMRLRFPMLNQ